MTKFARVLCSISLIVVLTAAFSQPAHACSCVLIPGPLAAADEAEAVFVGRATEQFDANPGPMIGSADLIRTTFQVSRSWKGPVQPSLVVESARMDASCGFHFETGKEYIVYAFDHDSNGKLSTSICSRTNELGHAQEDLNDLGLGQLVTVPTQSVPLISTVLVVGGMAAGVLVTVLFLIGIVMAHRREIAG